MIAPYKFEGIYSDGHRIFTQNLVPGMQVYGENLVEESGVEYRAWNPKRSKLGAAILAGCKDVPLKQGSIVLYLGAATGTTPSHVSDIAKDGTIFCVEISPRSFRYLIPLCEERKNMVPIMADADAPQAYAKVVPAHGADVVYQDIAQREQVGIFLKNTDTYLKEGGTGILAIKARSIDVTSAPKDIFEKCLDELAKHVKITDAVNLAPYEDDHLIVFCARK